MTEIRTSNVRSSLNFYRINLDISESAPLRLNLLGNMRVRRGNEAIKLPPSRKTRALLGFLALTGRPHRRERLCEIFWDLPDDPRGSLRWSLSKIRGVVNGSEQPRLEAGRERIGLTLTDEEVDLRRIRSALASGALPLGPGPLTEIAEALEQPLLEGLDMPRLDAYQAWLTAERADAAHLRLSALRRLVEHPDTPEIEALAHARAWHDADPFSTDAAAALAARLRRMGRLPEAEAMLDAFRRVAREAGFSADLTPAAVPVATTAPAAPPGERPEQLRHRQTIGFCTATDGVRIAYATVGAGPPLVKAANWLNHLELDWGSPIWSRTFEALAAGRSFIRYDERGNGLSDWDVPEITFDAFVRDLETVADTLGLERFPLLGMSQGCAVSIDYAVRHPEKVSALVLIGGYASGWRIGAPAEERERREAVMTLTRLGWGGANPAYRRIFSHTFIPDATPEELVWFDEFQRLTTSAENALRFQDAFGDIDVRHLLGQVRCPTLVLHARDDQRITLAQGREVAIGIPGARFVALDSRSHILLGHEPAWEVCMAEIERFLAEHGV